MPNTSISFPANPAVNQQYTYGTTTYVWTGTSWMTYIDSASLMPTNPAAMNRQLFSGTGAQTQFTLASNPGALGNGTNIYINGIYQQRNTYTISNTTLTFSAAPPAGTNNIEVVNFVLSSVTTVDSSFVTYLPTGTGAVTRSASSKFGDTVSVKDFGAVGDGVTDDTAAITNAIAASAEVYFPKGQYRITTGGIALANVTLRGCGVPEKGSPYTDNGSVILLDSTTTSPFALGRGVTIEGMSFFYPNQDGSAVSPTVYPPLFAGTYITQFLMQNCTVVNAYQFFKVNDGSVGAGDLRFDNCRIYAINRAFWFLNGAPEVIKISSCMFSLGVYEDVANVAPYHLRTYTATNGEFIRVDCGSGSKTSVDGLGMDNTLVFGMKYGIRIISGALDVSNIAGCKFDGVQTALSVEGSSIIRNTSWVGNLFYSYNLSANTSFASSIAFNTTGAVSRALFSGNDFAYSYGNHFTDSTTGIGDLILTGNSFANWGQTSYDPPADYYAIAIDDSGSQGIINGNKFKGVSGSNNPNGIFIADNADVVVIGNQFQSCYVPVQVTGGTKARIIGNSSSSTGYTQSFIDSDSGAGDVEAAWNSWDKNGNVIAFPSFHAAISGAQTFIGATGIKTLAQFATEVYDQDANYDPSTHTFTAPVEGTYLFDLVLTNAAGVTVGDFWNATIERTGVATQTKGVIQYVIANQVGGCSLVVQAQFILAAGDAVKAYMTRGGGTGNWVQLADATYNYFQGRRVQ